MQSNNSTTNNNLSTEQSHDATLNSNASIQNTALENTSINSNYPQHHSDSNQKHSPLDQFKIHTILDFKIGKLDLSITNSAFL